MSQLRLAHFIVQPVLVWDDGDEMTPGPGIDPKTVTLSALRDLAEKWPEHLAELAAQAQKPADEPAKTD